MAHENACINVRFSERSFVDSFIESGRKASQWQQPKSHLLCCSLGMPCRPEVVAGKSMCELATSRLQSLVGSDYTCWARAERLRYQLQVACARFVTLPATVYESMQGFLVVQPAADARMPHATEADGENERL